MDCEHGVFGNIYRKLINNSIRTIGIIYDCELYVCTYNRNAFVVIYLRDDHAEALIKYVLLLFIVVSFLTLLNGYKAIQIIHFVVNP